MRDGAIEETKIPRNPLDVLAQQIVAICADEEIRVDDLHALVARRLPVRRPLARAARERARHARRAATRPTSSPSCGRGSSGTAPPASSAAARARSGSRSRTRARSPTAASSACFLVDGRRPRRRARRGDGLRGARGPDVPARRDDVADRGDHPRPGARLAGARACPGAVPFWKGEGVGRPYELGEAIGAASRELVGAARRQGARATARRVHARRPRRAEPAHLPRASSRPRPAPCPPTARSSSSASATRSATGGVCILTPFGGAGARALGAGDRRAAARVARARGAGDLVGRRDRDPPSRRRRAAADSRSCCSSPTRSRSSSRARWGRPRSSARASARTPAARC